MTASDPDVGASPMFSISGGVDKAKFQINAASGELIQNAPDLRTQTDQDANNLYEVTVRASDGSLYDDQVISVSVTDVFENMSPSNLAAGSLTITENQPIGTVVGEFNATDPEGGAISYHLVSGIGDGTILFIYIGCERYAKRRPVVFDYETNASTYSIRVQAKDEFNASVEGNFTVTLMDLNEALTSLPMEEDQPLVSYWRRIKLASLA